MKACLRPEYPISGMTPPTSQLLKQQPRKQRGSTFGSTFDKSCPLQTWGRCILPGRHALPSVKWPLEFMINEMAFRIYDLSKSCSIITCANYE